MSQEQEGLPKPKFPWGALFYLMIVWIVFCFLLSIFLGPWVWIGVPVALAFCVVGLSMLAFGKD